MKFYGYIKFSFIQFNNIRCKNYGVTINTARQLVAECLLYLSKDADRKSARR